MINLVLHSVDITIMVSLMSSWRKNQRLSVIVFLSVVCEKHPSREQNPSKKQFLKPKCTLLKNLTEIFGISFHLHKLDLLNFPSLHDVVQSEKLFFGTLRSFLIEDPTVMIIKYIRWNCCTVRDLGCGNGMINK